MPFPVSTPTEHYAIMLIRDLSGGKRIDTSMHQYVIRSS
jgi:hypothetical protein